MNETSTLIANTIENYDEFSKTVPVVNSYEMVRLISEDLYPSPYKAIEELVVNAYDAEASECRVYMSMQNDSTQQCVMVFDNGIGMDYDGIADLWKIGVSNKRTEQIELKRKRKQIRKFGIGKLASYVLANRLTYITKSDRDGILSTTIDFSHVLTSSTESESSDLSPVRLPVPPINWDTLSNDNPNMSDILSKAGVNQKVLTETKSWTIVILEDLKEKSQEIKKGRLEWILSTAMPLGDRFSLHLNGQQVQSSKEDSEAIVTFDLKDLPKDRLEYLHKETGEKWSVQGESLKSDSFKLGITGTVKVTEKILYGGKSDDLMRSHGFFIMVRGRLINENDPLFGMNPMTYDVFNRLRVEIEAEDFDEDIKTSREGVAESSRKRHFLTLLREVFNEASNRYKKVKPKDDKQKNVVTAPQEIEYPISDFLSDLKDDSQSTERDDFFYLEEIDTTTSELDKLLRSLHNTSSFRRELEYEYKTAGRTERLVKFNPQTFKFTLNKFHELTAEYVNDRSSRRLLENLATAEVLLEIYLRLSELPSHEVEMVLAKRDSLLRKLVKSQMYAPRAIANSLRDAASDSDSKELEQRVVDAARSLGFHADHISGPNNPDGIARIYGGKKITLEAKSSNPPSLPQMDFATLERHKIKEKADGCLLVCPAYPGKQGEDSAVAELARRNKVSCWTVNQLAKYVEDAESRQFHATDLLDIVLKCFSPHEVVMRLEGIASQPVKNKLLYSEIVKALEHLEDLMVGEPRTITMIRQELSAHPDFKGISEDDLKGAIKELSGQLNRAITLQENGVVRVHIAIKELKNRLPSF